MEFPEVPIGDLVVKCSTWNPKASDIEEFDYIDLSSVDKDEKAIAEVERHRCSDAPSRARQLVKENDVLVATVRPNLNGVAIVGEENDGMTASTGYCVLRPVIDKLNPRFLFHWVKTGVFVQRMVDVASGANYPAVSDAKVKASTIPLPPLAEQKRIACILDAADALRVKRREALAKLDTFLQSTFNDMFGDPVTNPMGWERISLGDVISIDAPMVDPKKSEYLDLLHYGPDRIEKNTGKLLPASTSKEDELISGKFLCSPGEILYSKIRPYLNKVAMVEEKCLCSADVYPLRPHNEIIKKEFLWMLLRSDGFLDYVAGFSRRANIPKVNRKQLSGYQTPLPPIGLQRRFATIVETVEKQKARMRAHLAELDALFASLQHRAFNGEL